jgi:hypothetical protein
VSLSAGPFCCTSKLSILGPDGSSVSGPTLMSSGGPLQRSCRRHGGDRSGRRQRRAPDDDARPEREAQLHGGGRTAPEP